MRAKPPGAITPALKLRGGLTVGDASPADIAKFALYLKAAAGAYIMLSPKVCSPTFPRLYHASPAMSCLHQGRARVCRLGAVAPHGHASSSEARCAIRRMRHLWLLSSQAATDTFGSLGPKTEMNELLLENGGSSALAAAIIGLKLLDGAAAPEAVVWGLAAPLFVSTKVISPSVSVTRSPYTAGAGLSESLPRPPPC